jgi:acyl carrier protein
MDSRSLDFADEILDATQGRGVDVVLNSLAGPAIEKGLTALAAHGRFLEIGKRDIYDNARLGLSPFRKGLTYCAIDVLQMCRERPALVGELLREVVEMIDDGILEPLPQQVFPAARAADAFRLMARAQHVGKIVISLRDRTDLVVSPRRGDVRLGEGTYLITGGLGDLGLGVARRMFEKGARNLALVGRGEGSAAARAAVEGLRRAGAEVRVMAADVSDRSAIEAVVREVDETMPPLRGIIHAAGVLDDAVIANTERDHFVAVMAPKVAGAWNLHETTAEMALDLFVMFSSSAALLGLSGQGNYAAANAFMDGLAHLRRAQRRPALSINWGPWAEVGLAASRGDRGVRLAEAGMLSYTPADGLQAFESLLMSGCAQAAAMPMDWARFHRATGSMAAGRRFERLIAFAGDRADREDGSRPESTDRDLRARLLACEPGRNRRGLLEGFLKGQVAQILRLDAARLGSHTPLRDFGLDSLMGLELRNRLEAALELSLPGTLVYNYPTIGQLAPHLGRLVQIPLDGDESGAAAESCMTPEDAELAELLAELDDLSPEEVRRLLTEQDGREASDG